VPRCATSRARKARRDRTPRPRRLARDATLKSIARLGIRPRLLLALPTFVLLVVATGTVFYLTSLVDLRLGSMVENGRLIAQQVIRQVDTAASVAPAQRSLATTIQRDRALTNLLGSYTAFSPFVLSVAVTDPDGKVLAHSTPAFVGEKAAPTPTPTRS